MLQPFRRMLHLARLLHGGIWLPLATGIVLLTVDPLSAQTVHTTIYDGRRTTVDLYPARPSNATVYVGPTQPFSTIRGISSRPQRTVIEIDRTDRNDRYRRYGHRRDIEDSILVNPVIIDSSIENSTLINPVIVDTSRRRTGVRGYYSSGTRPNCHVMANFRAACQ